MEKLDKREVVEYIKSKLFVMEFESSVMGRPPSRSLAINTIVLHRIKEILERE